MEAIMLRLLFIQLCVCILLGTRLISCRADPEMAQPPPTFVEADVIGTWTNPRRGSITDTLTIRADHTFRQQYATAPNTRLTEVKGKWRLENRPSGCIYLHMEGMRYIYAAEIIANNGNRAFDGSPHLFREACEETSIAMLDKVILSVGNDPRAPRGIILRFPFSSTDGDDNYLELAAPAPSPTASSITK